MSTVGAIETSLSTRARGTVLFWSRALALLALFLLPARIFVGYGVGVGHILALAMLPLWLPGLLGRRGGGWLVFTGVLGAGSAVWLTTVAAVDHSYTVNNLIANTMLLLGVVLTVGVFIWAQRMLPVWLLGAVYGAGLVFFAVMRPSTFDVNPWKFAIGLPVAVLTLSLAMRSKRRFFEVITLIALAGASILMDSRAFSGVFAIVLLVMVWQSIPVRKTRAISSLRVLLSLALIGLIVYVLGTSLLLEGYLGADAQARSVEQQDRAGSIIVGGRPELAATAALFLHRPLGFGAGTIATPSDILIAKTGMHVINYDPDNGYVENFMFGTKFELHSLTGDVWAYFGWPGLLFLVVAGVIMVRRVTSDIGHRNVSALFLFAVAISGWNLFFNPMYTDAPYLALAVALALRDRSPTSSGESASVASATFVEPLH